MTLLDSRMAVLLRRALRIIAWCYVPELEMQWAERRVLIRDTERVLDEYAQRMGQRK
jgi:hypothetical protein